ncbi:MAG: hypothetical protein ABIJ05_05125 [Patescibacteria group bacterium]
MVNKKQSVSTGGAIIFKDYRGRRTYLLTKQNKEDNWEIPKIMVRKAESSVRSVIRMSGEMAGMNVKVLEEAGRASGAITLNGKILPQKYYYYLMVLKDGGSDPIGFADAKWMDYSKTLKTLKLKREKDIFKDAKKVLREWEKQQKKK